MAYPRKWSPISYKYVDYVAPELNIIGRSVFVSAYVYMHFVMLFHCKL